jgi:hypothetical protein
VGLRNITTRLRRTRIRVKLALNVPARRLLGTLGIFRMEILDHIIQQGTTGRINRADAEAYCVAKGIEMTELYNHVALSVAKRFDAGELSYEDGDMVMNAVFSMMTDGDANNHPNPFVEPAWSIYLAFDEGEYDHAGSTNPVESFTRPQIRKILEDAQQLAGPERRGRVP